ncbi:BTB/POZ and MATH domain-containing protein 2-like [Oryza brachyantha]|uniref:BTB domain-containing protein n=1 Tax=Oryza brachyantha TaxID=4533 RepID=J3LY06_ORYBR|nr:BTB/POZ and MATH domain-containing protein 2-like [Oryza brachyantha]
MPTASGKLLRSASAIVGSTESGQHLLEISGYSVVKDAVATGSCVQSRHFHVGGHDWYILYYPNGFNSVVSDCISIYLAYGGNPSYQGYYYYHSGPAVRAELTLSLLDQAGEPAASYTYRHGVQAFHGHGSQQGSPRFVQKAVLERSEYLRDNRFTVRCDVTVVKNPEAKDVVAGGRVTPPPPSDLAQHLGGLLATGVAADVAFEVDGRAFMAHRNVLAVRSPVFHAELFAAADEDHAAAGAGAGAGVTVRIIDDMEAQDFEALLHFVYTDSLPEKMEGGDMAAMLPDLVAAARRYKMERLRLVCEDKLCEHVNVRTVAAMLAFAGEHHCHELEKKCLQLLDDPANLRKIVETDGLEHLTRSYPLVLRDLIAKFATKP